MSGVFSFAAPFFGRAKKGANKALAWDEENRIKSNTDNGITTEYKYDSKGERIVKKGSYGEVVYVNNNYAIRNGVISTKNIFAGNTRICSKVANGTTQQGTYYYHADHLGSSNLITDKQASFKEHLEYFPYGEMWVEERSNSALDIRYAFTGKEYDPETGLYYFGARYLDPRLGMWTTIDPPMMKGDYFSKPGDFETDHDYFYELAHDTTAKLKGHGGVFNPVNMNLYHYAGQNPVKFVDPDGNATEKQKIYASVFISTGYTLLGGKNADAGAIYNFLDKADNAVNRFLFGNPDSIENKLIFNPPGFGGLKGVNAIQFLKAGELAKRLGTTEKVFHTEIKSLMKKEFSGEMKKIGTTNPDIGVNKLGNVVLKNPKSGKTIVTDVPLNSYGKGK